MTWAKLDDQFHANRKAKIAWRSNRASLGLHLFAISYCGGQLTDGLVDLEFVEEKLPVAKERKAAIGALVDAGLWVAEGDHWRINDWLDYNPSKADVLAKRAREAERRAVGRTKQRDDSVRARSAQHDITSDGPVPTRPDPSITPPLPPASGGRKRSREKWVGEMKDWAAHHLPDLDSDRVLFTVSRLRAGGIDPTPQSVRDYLGRETA